MAPGGPGPSKQLQPMDQPSLATCNPVHWLLHVCLTNILCAVMWGKKQRRYFANKGPSSQGYGFSRGHVWELDCNESWALKNWCFWTVVLEKTLESSLDCKEIQPIHSKGNQSWVFFRRTDAKAETPVLWPPHVKKGVGGERHNRRWDGWMASPTRWTWVWVNSGIWWWTGRPGMLWFMGPQTVRHDWVTELIWSTFNL